MATLEEELDCVQAYCNMMQIRYGDNLRFDFDIDAKYLKYNVLPLSIDKAVPIGGVSPQSSTDSGRDRSVASAPQDFVWLRYCQ